MVDFVVNSLAKLHSFANFSLNVGLWDLQMCAMWGVNVLGEKQNKFSKFCTTVSKNLNLANQFCISLYSAPTYQIAWSFIALLVTDVYV